jgi:hypothetical protein
MTLKLFLLTVKISSIPPLVIAVSMLALPIAIIPKKDVTQAFPTFSPDSAGPTATEVVVSVYKYPNGPSATKPHPIAIRDRNSKNAKLKILFIRYPPLCQYKLTLKNRAGIRHIKKYYKQNNTYGQEK